MRKKKTKTCVDTTTRCIVSQLKFGKKSKKMVTVREQMLRSKNVYNSGVYFQRKWYELTRLICIQTLSSLDTYIPYLTKHDIETLIKFAIKEGDLASAHRLFQLHQDEDILSFIKDKEVRNSFIVVNENLRRQVGRSQTSAEILDKVRQLESSEFFQLIVEDKPEKKGHLLTFIDQLKVVLSKAVTNKEATEKKKAADKNKDKVTDKKKAANSKEEGNKENAPKIPRVLPPSYLGMTFIDLYVKQFIPSYSEISSQVAQQTLQKVNDAYSGFFESTKNGIVGAKPPMYNRTDKYNLIFQTNSFNIEAGVVRLSLGKAVKKKDKEVGGDGFLRFKISSKILSGKEITEVELVPSQYKDRHDRCTLVLKYKVVVSPVQPTEDNLDKASLDLGVGNVAVMYSPRLERPLIFDGRFIIGINKSINHSIDCQKSYMKKQWDVNSSHQVQDCLIRRMNKITDYLNQLSSKVISICEELEIKELIIGYNTNWKNKVNLGHETNRTFYEVPYSKLIHMLFYKGEERGIRVVENEEAYTSKCDALALEDIRHHDRYLGKRVHRGLFSSSVGVLINADVNGAINIMRKYVYKTYATLSSTLNSIIRSTPFVHLCNPVRITHSLLKSFALETTRGVWGQSDLPFKKPLALAKGVS